MKIIIGFLFLFAAIVLGVPVHYEKATATVSSDSSGERILKSTLKQDDRLAEYDDYMDNEDYDVYENVHKYGIEEDYNEDDITEENDPDGRYGRRYGSYWPRNRERFRPRYGRPGRNFFRLRFGGRNRRPNPLRFLAGLFGLGSNRPRYRPNRPRYRPYRPRYRPNRPRYRPYGSRYDYA